MMVKEATIRMTQQDLRTKVRTSYFFAKRGVSLDMTASFHLPPSRANDREQKGKSISYMQINFARSKDAL